MTTLDPLLQLLPPGHKPLLCSEFQNMAVCGQAVARVEWQVQKGEIIGVRVQIKGVRGHLVVGI